MWSTQSATMVVLAALRQVRWKANIPAKTHIPLKRMKLTAEKGEMLPAIRGPRGPVGYQTKRVVRSRNKRSITVVDPRTTARRRPVIKTSLTDSEADFVQQAHRDLEKEGVGPEARLKAWLDNDESVFPDKVRDLQPHVQRAVKFGGLGLTTQAEHLKERYAMERKQLEDEEKQAELEKEEARMRRVDRRETQARKQYEKRMKRLESMRQKLKEKRKELVNSVLSSKQSGSKVDRDLVREAQYLVLEDQVMKAQVARTVEHEREALRQMKNARAVAEGRDPVSVSSPEKSSDGDLSALIAECARVVLVQVPSDGRWPLNIPSSKIGQFNRLANMERHELLAGKSRKERFEYYRREKRQEAYVNAKSALKTWNSGEEFGGVRDARDWRQKHKWEWKDGKAPKRHAMDDPFSPWQHLEKEIGAQAVADGAYQLMEGKTTADKPKSRFDTAFGDFHRKLNQRQNPGGKVNKVYYARTGEIGGVRSKRMRTMMKHTAKHA